ncbi:MAG: hypothetical protein R3D88_06380 [Alphaproteobacteria bacterium]|nr:hypothetical protein [Alphaproteobacteria bacterium]
MTPEELQKMKDEFAAKGGQTTKLDPANPGGVRCGLGQLVKIETAEHGEGKRKQERVVFVVYLFNEEKTVRMLTRVEDRVGIQVGEKYNFTYKTHLEGRRQGNIDFVTRGTPTEIKKSQEVRPSA